MKKLGMKKNRWENLDLLTITLKENKQDVIIFVNSEFFFRSLTYTLQKIELGYHTSGFLEKIWDLIAQKKYKDAYHLLMKLESDNEYINYTRFVVFLFLGKDAFPFLRECILQKSHENDDNYRIYLELYSIFDEELDTISLMEMLSPEKEILAISSKSYNGLYLKFLSDIRLGEFKKAKKSLSCCITMKPDSFHLMILEQLLKLVLKKEEELEKKKKKQERELEKERCEKFISLIKEKDYSNAKKQVELILSYRNVAHKNSYVYQLFWELLEMILIFKNDITFEIPEVSYTYKKESDAFYTFLEAISVGDFKVALKVGKKCRNKTIDPSEPKLKVGTYLVILEDLLSGVSARVEEQETIYRIVQNNIQRGHFVHALELYQNNKIRLSNYQSQLLMDLFQSGITIERKEISFQELYYEEDKKEEKVEQISIEDIPPVKEKKLTIEDIAMNQADISIDEKRVEAKEEKNSKEESLKEEIFYPVEPLLKHIEPNHEYFIYFTKCLEFGQYEEARYWLTQFGGLLKTNQIQKRLDHYYYMIEVSYSESLEEKNLITKKEELYSLAYNAVRNYDYEKSITYLEYYMKMDSCRNNKALILKGYAYRKMGKYENAIECFIQANSISPTPDAYYFLGDIYYKQHRFKDAIFCYITYNEFYPKENITVYLNLSECYRKLNNSKKVLKYLKMADEINTSQGRGLNLKNRILRAEMTNQKKEKFRLERIEKKNC